MSEGGVSMDIGKYHYTGGSVITSPFEGVVLHFHANDRVRNVENAIDIAMDKHDAAHVASLIQGGRKYWKAFKLPKMYEQTQRYCRKCRRITAHDKKGGKWKCINHE